VLTVIGTVTNVHDDVSTILIDPEFAEGLYRIEECQELDVLFVFDRSEGYDMLVHPRGDPANPLMGVFATRSPRRPSPIGLTRVRLLERRDNMLTVKGLDAFLGTPIVDIKRASAGPQGARIRYAP